MNKWFMRYCRNCTFRAPDGAGAGAGSSSGSATSQGTEGQSQQNQQAGNQSQQGQQTDSQSTGTFSQADLNRIGAQEKANGKKAMLKELGFKDEAAAKEAITKYNEWLASQQSEAEKAQAKINAATAAQGEAETRALVAEQKLEVIKQGGNPQFVDDILALVNIRVNDTTDFNKALEDVKKAHTTFFGNTQNNDTGTGGGLNRKTGNQTGTQGIGARLAKNHGAPAKNPYFEL